MHHRQDLALTVYQLLQTCRRAQAVTLWQCHDAASPAWFALYGPRSLDFLIGFVIDTAFCHTMGMLFDAVRVSSHDQKGSDFRRVVAIGKLNALYVGSTRHGCADAVARRCPCPAARLRRDAQQADRRGRLDLGGGARTMRCGVGPIRRYSTEVRAQAIEAVIAAARDLSQLPGAP
jgi:hypothetical protein